jgi:hypothetical protein
MLTPRIRGEVEKCRLRLPLTSDSNLIFAGSVSVTGRKQRPLLPEMRVSEPE